MMSTIYLAGPIFGRTTAECSNWRNEIKRDGRGHSFLDPTDRDFRGGEDQAYRGIVEGDKADIRRCDIVIANCQIRGSAGTSMEILYSYMLEIPVIAIVGEKVSPWIRYHASILVHNIDKVLDAIPLIKMRDRNER